MCGTVVLEEVGFCDETASGVRHFAPEVLQVQPCFLWAHTRFWQCQVSQPQIVCLATFFFLFIISFKRSPLFLVFPAMMSDMPGLGCSSRTDAVVFFFPVR